MSKIGIIGCGFVGSSIKSGLCEKNNVNSYDKYNPDLSTVDNLPALVKKSDILFVCVPTPMNKDGSCDTRIVESTVLEVDKITNPLSKKIEDEEPCSTKEENRRIASIWSAVGG